jgi:hypothetical protein
MLSNLRKKIVQKDIKTYSELKIVEWGNSEIISHLNKYSNFGNQRYSKNKVEKTFEKSKIIMFVPYEIDGKIYNMIPCFSGSFIKGHPDIISTLEEKKIEKSFLLGETEITQELYCAVMNVKNPSDFQGATNPVENVSWYDAVLFCNKLSDMHGLDRYYTITKDGKTIDTIEAYTHYKVETNKNSKGFRLPTEDEWEYAAKAGTQLLYSGSNNVDEVGWHEKNSNNKTNPVKGKKPNAWGFYDMSGNVQEWCENTWNSIPARRILRGGSWGNDTSVLRSAYRNFNTTYTRHDNIGFRVARYL